MRDRVTIAYRGAAYELGGGRDYYGLWVAGAAPAEPLERWPRTTDGWVAAWTRFTAVETPGTIAAAGRGRSSRPLARAAAGPAGPAGGAAEGATAVLPWAPAEVPPPAEPASQAAPAEAWPAEAPAEARPPEVTAEAGQAEDLWTEAWRTGPRRTESAAASTGGSTAAEGTGVPLQQTSAFAVPSAATPAYGVAHEPADVIEYAAGGTFARPADGARAADGASTRRGLPALVASALLTVGVILGVIGLFPSYFDGSSVASQPPLLVTHVAYLAGWTIAAVLIALGGVRRRSGALLAIGLSVVTIGLLLSDLFNATTAHVSLGAGTWLGLTGWLLCTAGGVLGLTRGTLGLTGRPRGLSLVRVAVLSLVAIGVAATFAPSWDSYLLRFSNGQSTTVTAGNAFANPALVIAANVIVMVLFALVVIVASLWRPVYLGAMLLAGAVLPMVAQGVSALVQISEPSSPAQFGITPQQASLAGLSITNGVTPWFWVFGALVVILVAAFAWMLITPHAAQPDAAQPDAEAAWDTDDTGTGEQRPVLPA